MAIALSASGTRSLASGSRYCLECAGIPGSPTYSPRDCASCRSGLCRTRDRRPVRRMASSMGRSPPVSARHAQVARLASLVALSHTGSAVAMQPLIRHVYVQRGLEPWRKTGRRVVLEPQHLPHSEPIVVVDGPFDRLAMLAAGGFEPGDVVALAGKAIPTRMALQRECRSLCPQSVTKAKRLVNGSNSISPGKMFGWTSAACLQRK